MPVLVYTVKTEFRHKVFHMLIRRLMPWESRSCQVENLRDRSAKKVQTFLANYGVFMRNLGLTEAVMGASNSKAPRATC